MDREDAYVFHVSSMPVDGVINTHAVVQRIDEIYDDFESRTCENCKYYFEYNGFDCIANESGMNIVSYSPKDFGCNKFERAIDG